MTPLKCDNCGAALGEADFDERRRVATCPFCGGRMSLPSVIPDERLVEPPPSATPAPTNTPVRRKVPRPDSISLSENVSGIRLTYRWFTPVLFGLLFFCIAWDSFLVFWYSMGIGGGGPRGPIAILFFLFPLGHVAVGIGLTYFVIAGFLNRTHIDATRDALSVTHGPVPWKGNKTLPAASVDQLYSSVSVGSKGSRSYEVHALMKDGRKEKLLATLQNSDEARYIERTIEDFLGLEHHPVAGEMP